MMIFQTLLLVSEFVVLTEAVRMCQDVPKTLGVMQGLKVFVASEVVLEF
jgi:hypothetical protein